MPIFRSLVRSAWLCECHFYLTVLLFQTDSDRSISATNDYANQGILSKVRKVDKEGERTLGIITKPDRLPSGSGSEASFLELAGNNDIFFKLGWHVLKNRKFEERDYSFKERNASETAYFATSNFKCLPKDAVGINSLRIRLSQLLFSHVKQELPKLQAELEGALADTKARLDVLGTSRATPEECRSFLTELSQVCHTICKAAADGHYEGQYFVFKSDESFTSTNLEPPIRRLRARIQKLNEDFVANFRQNAHTYSITNPTTKAGYAEIQDSTCDTPSSGNKNGNKALSAPAKSPLAPEALTREKALQWVRKALTNNRGRELSGNFNPLVVGELFWDQSKKWELFVEEHIENVAATCTKFLKDLFKKKYPQDVRDRVWREQMQEVLNDREANARHELGKIMKDNKKHPINYNSYYTETVTRDRQKRKYDEMTSTLNDSPAMLDKSYTSLDGGQVMAPRLIPGAANIELAMEKFKNAAFSEGKVDIDRHACEEALDCLVAIYQVNLETFIANVAVQIVERHIVCDIEEIFCPVEVNKLSDKKIMDIAEEPAASRRQRAFLKDRIAKLEEGRKILRRAMSGTI
jgi:hypothetical protein